jgi:hypothetical protein
MQDEKQAKYKPSEKTSNRASNLQKTRETSSYTDTSLGAQTGNQNSKGPIITLRSPLAEGRLEA